MKNFTLFKDIIYPLIIVFLIFSLIGASSNCSPEYEDIEEIDYSLLNDNGFTKEELIFFIDKLNFKYPEVILAQSMLETGHYTSEVFCSNNNLFGMRQPFSRINISGGTKNGHSYYNNWVESIVDYGFWYSTYAYKCSTREEFLDLLDKTYAEDKRYKLKLLEIIQSHNLEEKFKKNDSFP